MLDQASNAPLQPATPPGESTKLWTPGFIAGVSFLLGFPAGIVIASINWMRMEMRDKALTHLIGGVVGAVVFLIILFMLPGSAGQCLGLVTNLGILFYLQQQMKKDIDAFKTTNAAVENAGQLGGCLIGLGVLAAFFLAAFVLAFALSMLGVPMPE